MDSSEEHVVKRTGQVKTQFIKNCKFEQSFLTVKDVKVMHMPPNPFSASAMKIRMDRSAEHEERGQMSQNRTTE